MTSSNDGTVKLWLVGSSQCLKTWRFGHGSRKRALKVAIFRCQSHTLAEGQVLDSDAVGKGAAVCLEDGSLAFIALNASGSDSPAQTIQASPNGKALTALAVTLFNDLFIVAVGTADGIVSIVSLQENDITQSAKVLLQFKRNSADVTSLTFLTSANGASQDEKHSLLVSSMDGLLYEAVLSLSANEVTVKVQTEYAGYDIDACNGAVQRGSDLYSAGKDGHLKRY